MIGSTVRGVNFINSSEENNSHPFRQRLQSRDPLLGTFCGFDSAPVVETLGWAGFDLICIDMEHGVMGLHQLPEMIRAAEYAHAIPLVRVAEPSVYIGRVLDAGAYGVIVSHIETAEDAEQVVAQVRYPPTGRRGAGPGRASAYGAELGRYLQVADQNVAAIVQVETKKGLDNIEEIAEVPGIDAVFIGPGDLSVSLGAAPGSAQHHQAIARIASVSLSAGVPVGAFAGTADELKELKTLGSSLFIVNADTVFLTTAAERTVHDAHAVLHETETAD